VRLDKDCSSWAVVWVCARFPAPTNPVHVFPGEELTIPVLRGDWRWVLLVFHPAEALLEFLPASAMRVCLSESASYPALASAVFSPGSCGWRCLA